EQMVKAMVEGHGPMYIRINRNDLPVVTDPSEPYHIGKMRLMVEGSDVVIFATGVMVQKSMEAAKILAKEGISVRVVNISTIKPLDTKALIAFTEGVKGVVTAEEHNVIGGLGSTVASALSKSRLPIEMLGIEDQYGTSAENYEILLKHYGLESEDVAQKVRDVLK
ncbi:MAG: transketolase family protein, partial [Spirochaetales bacterium]|nr:transketolase family protein [Spirochaetales bacterium]